MWIEKFLSISLLLGCCFCKVTEFRFSGNFECKTPTRTPICIQVVYWEYDEWSSDDLIADSSNTCSTDYIRRIDTIGFMDGDGILDGRYEVYMKVSHNCNKMGRTETTDLIYLTNPTTDTDIVMFAYNKTL